MPNPITTELDIRCVRCGARPGKRCVAYTTHGGEMNFVHFERRKGITEALTPAERRARAEKVEDAPEGPAPAPSPASAIGGVLQALLEEETEREQQQAKLRRIAAELHDALGLTPPPAEEEGEDERPQVRRGFVVGRLYWDSDHPSPWLSFKNITAFKAWASNVRRARPGTKTEHVLVDAGWTATSMLEHVRDGEQS